MAPIAEKRFTPYPRLLAALFIAAMVSWPAQFARADVFEVKNVGVDVKAATAAEARKQALAQAERRAFYVLVSRMTLSEDEERIPEFSNAEIAPYVRDFSVAREKASSVRYIARLNYRFKPDAIRGLLRSYNVPFAETPSKPMVVLPVYEIGASAVLWDEPNPWRQAWSGRDRPEGLVPLIVPIGDLSDISTVGVSEAMAGDTNRLGVIAERYAAADTVVAHNNQTADPASGRQMMTVTLLRPSDPIEVEYRTDSYIQNEGETPDAMMARVTEATAKRIENIWKRRNLISQSGTGVLAVTIPITGLKDWLTIRDQLSRVGIIRESEIVLMSKDQVRVNVHFVGGAEQLITALEQANLSMLQESGEWIIMPIGVFQPPKT
ncbi:DUF2066 domain-containing protein [Thalassospiraceae bacterium LMO-JJ14]|nr:DUF2066 domain-containing protein [Thalassospiraceae bacterium LMO-JJ14]